MGKEGVTIKEATKLKNEMQENILNMIEKYEEETGLSVESVDLVKISAGKGASAVVEVNLDVKL